MKAPLILALDIGTSSVRAGLYDGNAKIVPGTSVKIELALTSTTDGGAEIDADVAFNQVAAAIDAVLEKTKTLKGVINYVASCSFWHSLLGVDTKGKPTTKVIGWADTRSRKHSETLKKRFDESAIHNRTGAHFHSSYWPSKLLWFRKEKPEIWGQTEKWLSFSEYVFLKLFGIPVSSISMASGTGIYDIRECKWDSELLAFLRVKQSNLAVVEHWTTYRLLSRFARRWPRLKNADWFPSIADGAADNVGAGCISKGRAALMVGTSGAMRVAYEGEPPLHIPDGLWCYRIDMDRVIVGGALSDGGGLYEWLKSSLKTPPGAADTMRRRGADAHGITFLPFFGGERGTGYTEGAKGAILGLTLAHDSTDILQAGMESVAYRLAEIFDRLRSVQRINEIVLSGGALRDSSVWAQIIADVLGRDLMTSRVSESSSLGAVLLALESIGKIDKIDHIRTVPSSMVTFHSECHHIYKTARKRHREAYDLYITKAK